MKLPDFSEFEPFNALRGKMDARHDAESLRIQIAQLEALNIEVKTGDITIILPEEPAVVEPEPIVIPEPVIAAPQPEPLPPVEEVIEARAEIPEEIIPEALPEVIAEPEPAPVVTPPPKQPVHAKAKRRRPVQITKPKRNYKKLLGVGGAVVVINTVLIYGLFTYLAQIPDVKKVKQEAAPLPAPAPSIPMEPQPRKPEVAAAPVPNPVPPAPSPKPPVPTAPPLEAKAEPPPPAPEPVPVPLPVPEAPIVEAPAAPTGEMDRAAGNAGNGEAVAVTPGGGIGSTGGIGLIGPSGSNVQGAAGESSGGELTSVRKFQPKTKRGYKRFIVRGRR